MSVFVKTPKGIEEVERKAHGLALKPRQVLIMIDGKRDRAALQGIFPPEMVPPILQDLLAGGFIRELEPEPVAPAPAADALGAQKEAMSAALYDVFGPDADNFTGKVDKAASSSELVQLAAKYADVVAKMGGRKKSDAFLARLGSVGIDAARTDAEQAAASVPSKAPGSNSGKPATAGGESAERYGKARNFMLNTIATYLGPVGSTLIDKIDATRDLPGLAGLLGEWQQALSLTGDGKKRLPEFEGQLLPLLGDSVAQARAATSSPAPDPVAAAVPKPKNDAERLDLARNFMVNTTNTFTGIVGSSLIIQIEQAKELRELRALYYDWREALQLSSAGRQRLPDLEKRLAALLS